MLARNITVDRVLTYQFQPEQPSWADNVCSAMMNDTEQWSDAYEQRTRDDDECCLAGSRIGVLQASRGGIPSKPYQ